jgi:hypothetical protein
MIVNIGKRVIVECGEYTFTRDADKPGLAFAVHRNRGAMGLPGNPDDARRFVEAYLRCVDEDIEYRKTSVE